MLQILHAEPRGHDVWTPFDREETSCSDAHLRWIHKAPWVPIVPQLGFVWLGAWDLKRFSHTQFCALLAGNFEQQWTHTQSEVRNGVALLEAPRRVGYKILGLWEG